MKIALITGMGMDASYLAEYLLSLDYIVHCLVRRSSSSSHLRNIEHIKDRIIFHYGDLTDSSSVYNIINEVNPDEIYNLGAMSHVMISFEMPSYTFDVNCGGVINILEAVRNHRNGPIAHSASDRSKTVKVYQASTSEMFGSSPSPQNELTPFVPLSPYAVAKHSAHQMCEIYRKAYGMFVSCGILFNHTSPRRGSNFLEQKVALYVKQYIKDNTIQSLKLGNLYSLRDFGHSFDYVRAMHLMLQQDSSDTFVVGTGQSYTIKYMVTELFKQGNVTIEWIGPEKSLDEKGIDILTGKVIIEIEKSLFRPIEVEDLRADCTKAREILGWEPEYTIEEILRELIT